MNCASQKNILKTDLYFSLLNALGSEQNKGPIF